MRIYCAPALIGPGAVSVLYSVGCCEDHTRKPTTFCVKTSRSTRGDARGIGLGVAVGVCCVVCESLTCRVSSDLALVIATIYNTIGHQTSSARHPIHRTHISHQTSHKIHITSSKIITQSSSVHPRDGFLTANSPARRAAALRIHALPCCPRSICGWPPQSTPQA